MEDFVLAIVWLSFFAAIFLGWYFYLKARNKERMALIERDKDVSEIYAKREIRFRFPWLKLGIIFTGFSVGIIMGFFIVERLHHSFKYLNNSILIFGIVFLFTAISIIIAYFADKPKSNKQ